MTQNSVDAENECKNPRKAFRIKVRGASIHEDALNASLKSSRPLDSRRDTVPSEKRSLIEKGPNHMSAESTQASFVEQIRRKFNDQKYMKREDVIKLLKQMQGND